MPSNKNRVYAVIYSHRDVTKSSKEENRSDVQPEKSKPVLDWGILITTSTGAAANSYDIGMDKDGNWKFNEESFQKHAHLMLCQVMIGKLPVKCPPCVVRDCLKGISLPDENEDESLARKNWTRRAIEMLQTFDCVYDFNVNKMLVKGTEAGTKHLPAWVKDDGAICTTIGWHKLRMPF